MKIREMDGTMRSFEESSSISEKKAVDIERDATNECAIIAAIRANGSDATTLRDAAHEAHHALVAKVPGSGGGDFKQWRATQAPGVAAEDSGNASREKT